MSGPGAAAAVLVLATVAALRAALAALGRSTVLERVGQAAGPSVPATVSRPRPPAHWAPSWLAGRLVAAGVDVDPAVAWRAWGASSVALVGGALVVGGAGAALVATLTAAGAPLVGWRLLRHRGQAVLEASLPCAVEAVARGLRSGASLRQAVAEAGRATPGRLGDELSAVATAVDRGATLVGALEAWAEQRPDRGVRLVVAALCLAAETGGSGARAVDSVAATLRQRLAAQGEARALATQARASALVIAVAPVAFCALGAVADARTASFLLGTPAGLLLLATGLALDAAGALWMARLTRIEP